MKKLITLILLVFFTISCKQNNTKAENKTIEISKASTTTKNKSQKNATYLCKINGKDWEYTKASGIIDKNPKTKKRTAIITFKKKLKRGSESIQLYYNTDSFKLERASLTLKFPKKGGGVVNGYYSLHPDTRKKNPESDMSGIIDLSNPNFASGNAELKKFNIKYEKNLLENPDKDAAVTVKGLKFNNIGYSDLDKAFKMLKK